MFYSEDLKLIPLNESRKVWTVELSYNKDYKAVIADIALTDCKNCGDYISTTRELFGDTSKRIKICDMQRLNRKKLDAMQSKLNAELPAIYNAIINHAKEAKTICELLATNIWNIKFEE